MNNLPDSLLSQILCEHLDTAIALACPKTHQIVQYNHKFCHRCIGQLSSPCLTIEQVIPNLNIDILNKTLKRNSVYRTSIDFQQFESTYPVDFVFSLIEVELNQYILIQGQDNPQSLEFKSMINSYDNIFKAQTKELNAEKEKSQQANQFKAQFLSRISHELRTPMNAVLGFAQLQDIALKGQNQPRQNNQQILNAGYDLIELIEKMFEFVELEQQDSQLNITACSTHHHLIEALDNVNQRLKDHHIQVDYPKKDATVKADPQKFTQILQELITNGIKFNDPGGRLDITLNDNQDGTTKLSFKTTANNIEPDEIEQLFTPFFRGQYAQDNEISGIGIGLVLAQRNANLINGNIHVSHEKEQGGITMHLNLKTYSE